MKKVLFSLLLAVLCLPFAIGQTKAPRTIITLDTTACDSLRWIDNVLYTTDTTVLYIQSDTVHVLNLTVQQAYISMAPVNVEGGCNYVWNGHNLLTDTTISDTLKTVKGGCDSVATISLHLTHQYVHDTAITAFNNYTWYDSTYTESTVASRHVAATVDNNCDSTFNLNLTINKKRSQTINIKACGSYHLRVVRNGTLPRDTTYTYYGDTASGTYYRTREVAQYVIIDTTFYKDTTQDTTIIEYTLDGLDSINGRDSLVALYMDTLYTYKITIADVKESYTKKQSGIYQWNGMTFSTTGIYDTVYHGANMCDSILHLDLTVEAEVQTYNVESCGSYKWAFTGNDVYYTDTTVTREVVLDQGDTVIKRLVLKINHPQVVFNDSACGTYTWRNNQYAIRNMVYTRPDSAKGTSVIVRDSIYRIDSTTMCDTLIRLNLKFFSVAGKNIDTAACTVFKFNGREFRSAMEDTLITTSARMCDTVYNVKLSIYTKKDTIDRQVCHSYIVGNDTLTADTVISEITTDTATGCVSENLLNLKIVNNYSRTDSVEACGSYRWRNDTLTASVDTVITVKSNDTLVPCDSTVRLVLTVANIIKTDTISQCGGYTNWRPFGQYTDTNRYYATTDLAANDTNKTNLCVTEHKLHLVIADIYRVDTTKYFCGSYYWRKDSTRYYDNGTILTLSTAKNMAIRGDSASMCTTYTQMRLNIVPDSVAPITRETHCEQYAYNFNGIVDTIRESQFREVYEANATTRCNITHPLDITILPISVGTQTIDTVTCEAFYMHLGDSNITINKDFNGAITATNRGNTAATCYDSTVVINLHVRGKTYTYPHNPTYNVCDRFVWYYKDRKVTDTIVNPRDTVINGATTRIQDTIWHWEIDPTRSITYTRTTTDSVSLGKDMNLCDSVAMLNLTVYHTPAVTIVGDWDLNKGEDAHLSYECDQPDATHTWSYDNSHGTSITIPNVQENTDITLISVGEGGCTKTSYITVLANDNLGLDQVETALVELYPNPTTAYLNLRSEQAVSEVAIFNTLGQQVSSHLNLGTATTLDLSQFATGTYTMRITLADGQTIIRKFIVSK